jgi:uncharacterized SAM-binding protein YcdF (DUF218 family)
MFYFLSKFLPLFVYPAGLACVLLAAALILRRRPRWVAGLITAALLVVGLGGNRLASMVLLRSLEWQHPSLTADEILRINGGDPVDAIVVLGGGARQHLAPRPANEIGEAGDRMIYAARLYRAGVAPVVLVSGGNAPLYNPGDEPESLAMAELLTFFGVPREAIVLESQSRNTYENAIESEELLDAAGMSHIVLVTSAMHMPRSYAIFKKLDLDVIPAPTDYMLTRSDWAFYTQPRPGVQVMNVIPKAEYMELTEKAMKEYIGIVVYRLRGWL